MSDIWTYFSDHSDDIWGWTKTTLWLAVLPVFLGLVIALPIGWVASRYRWSYPGIVSGAGLLYTIPSIVLFLVMPGILGTQILAPLNVAVALTVYTVALLTRTVADALSSVSRDTLAAASAMGFTGWQRFAKVQIPLAVPVIGAGLRVAAVSNVSLISVASIIGVSQLGQLFIESSTTNTLSPAVIGLILFLLIALVFDALILLGLRLMTPWQRAAARR